jgi:hypothetical protein
MPSSKGTNFTPVDREARLRHKLVNNEMNPIVDAVLTVILLCVSPFIYLFALVHDKVMFKFLNKTYIYNVSWEVKMIIVRIDREYLNAAAISNHYAL